MATKKTATTITTRQIYEKVCAMEKMLKECLEGPPLAKAEPQPYLAAAAPDLPLSVIRLADAPDILPCFDETDMLYGLKDIPVMMSYCPEQVLRIGEEHYLTGPMIFFRIDEKGIYCTNQNCKMDLQGSSLHRAARTGEIKGKSGQAVWIVRPLSLQEIGTSLISFCLNILPN